MKFTIKQFNETFPNDDVCLQFMFDKRYSDLSACYKCGVAAPIYYRVKGRKCFECKDCGYQIHPLANTIFHKSDTPLKSWFFAIYLFSASKNGVAAKELERHLDVTYKTAWRMAKHIRMLMEQDGDKLSGIVEVDETYIGGRARHDKKFDNKTAVIGIVEKQKNVGQIKTLVTKQVDASVALPFMRAMIKQGGEVYSDESRIYHRVKRDFIHQSINHSAGEYARGPVTTNTIEGFWSQMKRSIDGTYHCVSPKYLQSYVNEFAYRYNNRDSAGPLFMNLISRA